MRSFSGRSAIQQFEGAGKFGGRSVADEEVGGHGDAYSYYYPADVFLVHFLGVVGAGVAAGQAAGDHQDGLGPENHFGDDEGDHGDAVDDADEQDFYSVHRVNIFHA